MEGKIKITLMSSTVEQAFVTDYSR